MKNNKLEELTKEIQKQVPGIMELKFGCRVKVIPEVRLEYQLDEAVILSNDRDKYFEFYFGMNIGTRSYNNGIDKIIGRDITLEDVLCFIEELYPASNASIHTTGAFIIDEKFSDCFWKLNKSLHEQDEEMINYLYNLIVKK